MQHFQGPGLKGTGYYPEVNRYVVEAAGIYKYVLVVAICFLERFQQEYDQTNVYSFASLFSLKVHS